MRLLAAWTALLVAMLSTTANAQDARVVEINSRYSVTVPESWKVLANNRMDRLKANLVPGLAFQANALDDAGDVIGQVQVYRYPSSETTQDDIRNLSPAELSDVNAALQGNFTRGASGALQWLGTEVRSVNGIAVLASGYERESPKHPRDMHVSRFGVSDGKHSFTILFSRRADYPEFATLCEAVLATVTRDDRPRPLVWTHEVGPEFEDAMIGISVTPSIDRRQLEERLLELIDEVNALGLGPQLTEVGLELASPEQEATDFRRVQSLFNDEGFAQAYLTLCFGLGLNSPGDTVASRLEKLFDNPFEGACAYYEHSRRAIVVRAERFVNALDPDFTLLHEIGHAMFDQTIGIESFCRSGDRTWEGTKIRRALIEGYAELIACAVVARRDGVDLAESFEPDSIRFPEGTSPVQAAPYVNGLRLLFSDFRRGGWESVNSRLRNRVASAEQLLHAKKRDSDSPTSVPLPYRLRAQAPSHSDTVGEIGIDLILRSGGAGAEEAMISSLGWDGDALQIYTYSDNEYGGVWRIVWDRVIDAQQFMECATTLRLRGDFSIRGRVVDWTFGTTTAIAQAARDALSAHPIDAYAWGDAGDAASTAAIEAVTKAPSATKADQQVSVEKLEEATRSHATAQENWRAHAIDASAKGMEKTLRLSAPSDWTLGEPGLGGIVWVALPRDIEKGNVVLRVMPLEQPLNLDSESRRSFKQGFLQTAVVYANMDLRKFQKLRISSGHKALVVTYGARTIARTDVEGYLLLVDADGFLVSLHAEARSISPALMTTINEVAMTLNIE